MLDKIELFEGLSLRELQDIEKIAQRLSLKRGEVIFSQGEYARDLYIIESGQVEISIRDFFQARKPVAILKNGDFFGEMALFDKNSVRSATARTLQNTSLVVIPGDEFERLLQVKPQISFKLLAALSRRLKDSNTIVAAVPSQEKPMEGKLITVASPRNGFGKTLFATTMAHLLSRELPRKVLYIDLDLYFAEGTFFMGVFSPRSICDLAGTLGGSSIDREQLHRFLVRHSDSLFSLPGPNNFVEGEKLSPQDITGILKAARSHFDYIIVDSDSGMSDILLTSIDMADHVFFLIDTKDVLSLKSGVRYFHGLSHLNYPEERMNILASRVKETFDPEKIRRLFKFRVLGGLPEIAGYTPEYGQNPSLTHSNHGYCQVIRGLISGIFHETTIRPQEKKGNLFTRWFFDQDQSPPLSFHEPQPSISEQGQPTDPFINEGSLSVILKFIRTNIIYGNLHEARTQILQLLEFCRTSSLLYQCLGEILMIEKNYAEAIDAFRQAVKVDQKNHLAMGFLAQLTTDEELFLKAQGLLQEVINAHPNYPDQHNDMGKLLLQRRDFPGAAGSFQKALDLNPNYLEARINLAVSLGEQSNLPAAIQELEMVQPKNIRVHYLLGKFYYASGKFFEALENFRFATEINPAYFDVSQRFDQLQDYFQRITLLIDMHRQVLAAHQTFPDLHFKMGVLLSTVGKFPEAEQEFKETLRLKPDFEPATVYLQTLQERSKYPFREALGSPLQSANGVGTTHFQLTLSLDENNLRELSTNPKNLFLIRVKNNRSGKQAEWRRTPAEVGQGSLQIDCSPLGSIAKNDILLVFLFDQASGIMLSALPHWVSDHDCLEGRTTINLSTSFRSIVANHPFYTPVKYFFVNFISENLAGAISGATPEYQATLFNPSSGATCPGNPNPDKPAEINFVLMSQDGQDVVKAGDTLQLRIIDRDKNELFSMDFAVSRESIEQYTQTISLDDGVA